MTDMPNNDTKLGLVMTINQIYEDMVRGMTTEEEIVKYMLHNQVKPPIKGETTIFKIKWRGIKIVRNPKDDVFLGLSQRGQLIKPDWKMIQMKTEFEEALIFGTSNFREAMEEYADYYAEGILKQYKDSSKQKKMKT